MEDGIWEALKRTPEAGGSFLRNRGAAQEVATTRQLPPRGNAEDSQVLSCSTQRSAELQHAAKDHNSEAVAVPAEWLTTLIPYAPFAGVGVTKQLPGTCKMLRCNPMVISGPMRWATHMLDVYVYDGAVIISYMAPTVVGNG